MKLALKTNELGWVEGPAVETILNAVEHELRSANVRPPGWNRRDLAKFIAAQGPCSWCACSGRGFMTSMQRIQWLVFLLNLPTCVSRPVEKIESELQALLDLEYKREGWR